MKNSKRILALLLSGVVLTGSFTSCLKKDDDEKTGSKGNSLEVGDLHEDFLVPKGIAEGKTFDLYTAAGYTSSSYVAEEETGDDLNDAIYQRNQLVEEYTGATLNFVHAKSASGGNDMTREANQIRTWIQANDTTYDAYVHVQHSGMPTLIEEGLFVDWNEIPYVNIENDWWYSNVARDICFGDKVFCMTGDYHLRTFAQTECLLFNKTMCDELGLEYPYQMVFDGTWTHDKFVEYIKKATKDLNGDGEIDTTNDRMGFGGWSFEQLPALWAAYGGVCIGKDDNNLPVLALDNERTYTVVDKMLEVFDNNGAFFEGKTYSVDDKMFNDGRLLFNDSFLQSVVEARSLENIDVGFIPYPKLDEDQEDYYSRTANIAGLTYIPVTNNDLEMTGAVLESLAFFSTDTVLDTYFDIVLTIKSTRDVESEQMIPIIRNSATFLDEVIAFDARGIVIADAGNTLSSYLASNKDIWEMRIEDLAELYVD